MEEKKDNEKASFLTKAKAFCEKKDVKPSAKLYFVDAMGSMAMGLFATLLIGTIFSTLAKYIPWGSLGVMSSYATAATGAVLGVAIAYALKAPPLVMFSIGVVGMCANALPTVFLLGGVEKAISAGPAGAFVCCIVATEAGKLVSKQTKVDILVTPVAAIGIGVLLAELICPAVAYLMYWIGYLVNYATTVMPLLMGIIISAVVGIVLTLPISSAALCAMIGITGIAGGAAVAGCCAQMVGFAVISFRENRWGGVVAQGLGTSMLQMGNIVKNPRIWLPPILASMITGPISTCIFKLECTGVSAGMGSCGLVGPIGVFADMGFNWTSGVGVLLVCILLPALLSLLFSELLRKIGWIKKGDMQLKL